MSLETPWKGLGFGEKTSLTATFAGVPSNACSRCGRSSSVEELGPACRSSWLHCGICGHLWRRLNSGADAFSLQVISTGNAQPTVADYEGVSVTTLATLVKEWNAASGHFTNSASTYTGNNVVSNAGNNERRLWFKILTPTSSTDDTEKTAVVTVTANSASTF